MVERIKWLVMALCLAPALVVAASMDIRLKDVDGKEHVVTEFIGQGKWTLVTVWSIDCPICRRDIYQMTFFHDEHRKSNATVLGISIDGYANRGKVREFIDEQSLNFPNLIGDPDAVSRLSGRVFVGTPTYYFFSPEGKFMTQRIGPVTQVQAEEIIRNLNEQRHK